jgi:hypothetical protein
MYAQAHHGDDQADHLAVLLNVVAVCIECAVRIKGDEPKGLRAGVHLRTGGVGAVPRGPKAAQSR